MLPELTVNKIIWSIADPNLGDGYSLGAGMDVEMSREQFIGWAETEDVIWEDNTSDTVILRFPGYNYEEYEDLTFNKDNLSNVLSLLGSISTYYNHPVTNLTSFRERKIRLENDLSPEDEIMFYHLPMRGNWFQGLLRIEPNLYQVMIGT